MVIYVVKQFMTKSHIDFTMKGRKNYVKTGKENCEIPDSYFYFKPASFDTGGNRIHKHQSKL